MIGLRRPPVLSRVDGPFVPDGIDLDEVDARWAAMCARNPAYFDGRLYQMNLVFLKFIKLIKFIQPDGKCPLFHASGLFQIKLLILCLTHDFVINRRYLVGDC